MIGQALTAVALGKLAADAADVQKLAAPWRSKIEAAARRHGVGPHVLLAIVWKESRFNPDAVGAAGEIGLAQMLPAAAADVGVAFGLLAGNPLTQLDAAAAFFALQLKRAKGDLLLAVRAYNGGFAGAQRNPALSLPYALDVLKTAAFDFLYSALTGSGHIATGTKEA